MFETTISIVFLCILLVCWNLFLFPVPKQKHAHLRFTISLLDVLKDAEPNESIFYSPQSVYETLLLAYLGSAGQTEREFRSILGLHWTENKTVVTDAYELEKNTRSNRDQHQIVVFDSVRKLYFSNNIKIK